MAEKMVRCWVCSVWVKKDRGVYWCPPHGFVMNRADLDADLPCIFYKEKSSI
ncbi:MAG: hypothetical protein V1850_05930 [Candidatus Bathyarchaeota archaeon]